MVLTVIVAITALLYYGIDYYLTSLDERHSHKLYDLLKPTGKAGHGYGVLGSLLMIAGVTGYMARKRRRFLSGAGALKYWLEFHIFLCTLGPVLILFHTTFKFGGIVAVSFWSMVAVMVSGVIGRFIYIQIPHTLEGRELSLSELYKIQSGNLKELQEHYGLNEKVLADIDDIFIPNKANPDGHMLKSFMKDFFAGKRKARAIKRELKRHHLPKELYKNSMRLVRSGIVLNRRIAWLSTMQNLFRYWHVAHLPFALIMLVIMTIHIVVALLFGYTWIF